jgi:hypothetical protein
MTPEAAQYAIRKLEAELFSVEREPVRNYSEATLRESRIAELKRAIANIANDTFQVGN